MAASGWISLRQAAEMAHRDLSGGAGDGDYPAELAMLAREIAFAAPVWMSNRTGRRRLDHDELRERLFERDRRAGLPVLKGLDIAAPDLAEAISKLRAKGLADALQGSANRSIS